MMDGPFMAGLAVVTCVVCAVCCVICVLGVALGLFLQRVADKHRQVIGDGD